MGNRYDGNNLFLGLRNYYILFRSTLGIIFYKYYNIQIIARNTNK